MAVDNTNVAMGWDDEFEEGSEFLLLPEGDYNFTITQFERAYFNGSDKLPAAPMAVVEMTIPYEGQEAKIKSNFILCKSLQWKNHQLFESVGLIKKGSGAQKLPWDQLTGKSGVCEITHRNYNGNTYNNVNKTYPVEDAPKVTKNSSGSPQPQFSL